MTGRRRPRDTELPKAPKGSRELPPDWDRGGAPVRERITFTPQRCREKAKALREQALKTRDPQERQELLAAAREMDGMAADLQR
jgi:hypothetical protein